MRRHFAPVLSYRAVKPVVAVVAERHPGMELEPYLRAFDRFSLRVKGDCMQPVIVDQALVYLKRQKIYLPGDVVTYRNGIGQLVCHRFLGYVLCVMAGKS